MGIREWHQHQGCVTWPRQQFERGPCDDTEGAFAAHHQCRQIVAGAVFQGIGPGFYHRTVHQHDLQVEHPILGDTVFDCTRTTAVLGEVSADGATAARRRIHSVKQPPFLHRFLHFLHNDARFDHYLVVAFVDGYDAVEPPRGQGNAALYRKSTTA